MREGATKLKSEINTRLSKVGTVALYSNIAKMFMDAMVFTKKKTYMMNSVNKYNVTTLDKNTHNVRQKHEAVYECDYYVKRQCQMSMYLC